MLKVEIVLKVTGKLIKEQTFGKMAHWADVNGPFLPQRCWIKQNKNALKIYSQAKKKKIRKFSNTWNERGIKIKAKQ